MDATGPRSSKVTELRNGAVIALGNIGRSGPEPIDVEIRRFLERTITGPGADRLTRYLASISLATRWKGSTLGQNCFSNIR